MSFENSWAAIFRPGEASHYFGRHAHRAFKPAATGYEAVNAWWLAELSRLVYRQHADEIGVRAEAPARGDVLGAVGLAETAFFNAGGSQAALVQPTASPQDFAVVSFRGSDDIEAWLDFNFDLVPVDWDEGGKVHQGFKEAFDAIWDLIANALEGLPHTTPVIFTGHSLGGGLATLAASRRAPTAAYTFGAPRVGDDAFAATVPGSDFYRVVNNRDVVTEVPLGLSHVGRLHYITHTGQFVVDPGPDEIFADRLKRDPSFELKRNLIDVLTGPPQKLADHAPVNYVTHLERSILATD